MSRHLIKENIRMESNHVKRCSTSLDIREMHTKTTMRSHHICARTGKMKNSGNTKCWCGCGETGYFRHCWWKHDIVTMENSLAVSWKRIIIMIKYIVNHKNYQRHSWQVYKRNKNLCPHKNPCTNYP